MQQLFEKIKEAPEFPDICAKYLPTMTKEYNQKFFIDMLIEKKFVIAKVCIPVIETVNFGNTHSSCKDNPIENPLIKMCNDGNLDAVIFLVENGADIETISFNNTTPVMFAFQNGHIDIVKYLLGKGAKTKTKKIKVASVECKDAPGRKMIEFAKDNHLKAYMQLIDDYDKTVKQLEERLASIEKESKTVKQLE